MATVKLNVKALYRMLKNHFGGYVYRDQPAAATQLQPSSEPLVTAMTSVATEDQGARLLISDLILKVKALERVQTQSVRNFQVSIELILGRLIVEAERRRRFSSPRLATLAKWHISNANKRQREGWEEEARGLIRYFATLPGKDGLAAQQILQSYLLATQVTRS